MSGQFVARRGLIALGDTTITGSLNISQNIAVQGTIQVSSIELVDTVVLNGETLVISSPKKILILGDLDVNAGGTVDIEVGATLVTFENITIEQ